MFVIFSINYIMNDVLLFATVETACIFFALSKFQAYHKIDYCILDMAERKLTLKEIVDKVYINLPEDENISEDVPSSENECSEN